MSKRFEAMPAEEFRGHREAIGTQEEVEELMQTARRTLGRWERGERPVPGVASVCIRLLRRDAEGRKARTVAAVVEARPGLQAP